MGQAYWRSTLCNSKPHPFATALERRRNAHSPAFLPVSNRKRYHKYSSHSRAAAPLDAATAAKGKLVHVPMQCLPAKTTHSRKAILGMGMITLAIAGLLYAWSIFVAPLEAEFGWNRSQTSLTFSLSMVFWSVGLLVNGQMAKRLPPKVCYAVALACLGTGFALCSLIRSLPQLYLCYGVLCGFGIGVCYGTWNTAVLAWFHDRIGFASGLLLMGFGCGSMVFGSLASALIYSPIGWRWAFVALAAIVVAEGLVAIRFLTPAPSPSLSHNERSSSGSQTANQTQPQAEAFLPHEVELPASQVLRTGLFWAFVVWRVLVMGIGGAIIAQAAVMMTGIGASVWAATLTVGLLGVGNGVSRPIIGAVYDRLGQNKTMIVLPAAAIVVGLGLVASYNMAAPALFAVFVFLEGALYGGFAALNTSFVRVTFGQKNLAMNLGVSSLTLLPANVVFPLLAAALFVATESYAAFFWLVPVAGAIALLAGAFIGPAHKRLKADWKAGKYNE